MPRTIKDLVEATGLERHTVSAGIRSGELPGYFIGRKATIPDEAFEDFIHGRWVPKPRPLFPNGVQPLVKSSDFIRKVG